MDTLLFGPQGALAQCGAGCTVFLDSVESLSTTAQARLLHALEPGFAGRLVAATSRPTAALRQECKLRDDLYYRLAADAIVLPTLRQRLEERPAERDELLQVLVARVTGRPAPAQVERIAKALDAHPGRHYPWPGNVLELEQAVRRVFLNGRYDGDAQAAAPDLQSQLLASVRDGNVSADALLAAYCQLLHRRHGTYEAVAEITKLDRRTAKKYVLLQGEG
jgi:transcriptional regulator of acetoin/glycerol metabolism